jgi:hypothetical protein
VQGLAQVGLAAAMARAREVGIFGGAPATGLRADALPERQHVGCAQTLDWRVPASPTALSSETLAV